jgi:hypothetical protein
VAQVEGIREVALRALPLSHADIADTAAGTVARETCCPQGSVLRWSAVERTRGAAAPACRRVARRDRPAARPPTSTTSCAVGFRWRCGVRRALCAQLGEVHGGLRRRRVRPRHSLNSRTPAGAFATGLPRRRSTRCAPRPGAAIAGRIATAHNQDDRVETFLMRRSPARRGGAVIDSASARSHRRPCWRSTRRHRVAGRSGGMARRRHQR